MLIPSGASITMAAPLGVDLSCVVGHEPADTVCVCFPSRERVQAALVSYLVTPQPNSVTPNGSYTIRFGT